ncbi:MAG: 30S ribosomal protein S9 [Bacteroidales bacterium]|jgi:small subunit ribosomal protein S9|nr:30S ribosomal protein S9 [Bacteroidales bacterium]MDD4213761.1 30S ribosomal protein S9 [Bacteroidales bacterium]
MEVIHTIGRRKTAVARVFFKEGSGNILVNKKDFKEYFPTPTLQYVVKQPLDLTSTSDKYDLQVTISGGGTKGQAEALSLAISRGLCKLNEENRTILKPKLLLRRDPRMVERKKPGQKKARKRFQFSKR